MTRCETDSIYYREPYQRLSSQPCDGVRKLISEALFFQTTNAALCDDCQDLLSFFFLGSPSLPCVILVKYFETKHQNVCGFMLKYLHLNCMLYIAHPCNQNVDHIIFIVGIWHNKHERAFHFGIMYKCPEIQHLKHEGKKYFSIIHVSTLRNVTVISLFHVAS